MPLLTGAALAWACAGANAQVTITGPTTTNLTEGDTLTLTLNIASASSPLTVVDFAAGNPPPAFVSIKFRGITNQPASGTVVLELDINPLYDGAGTHTFTVRAEAANSDSATVDITLVVADNPALVPTYWTAVGGGNWSDPGNWSAGVPDSTKYAVIDVAGTYTVTLNVSATVDGLMVGASSGVQNFAMNSGATLTLNRHSEVRSNALLNLSSGTLAGAGRLLVRGTLNWTAGTMDGSGTTRVALGAVGTNSGAGDKYLLGPRRFENAGTLYWLDGDIRLEAFGARWVNLAGALWDIQCDKNVFGICGGEMAV